MNVEEYFEIYTGDNDYIKTWTPKALKDFAEDYHKMKMREMQKENKSDIIASVSNSLPVKCKTIGMNGELGIAELSIDFAGETITELSRKLKIAEDFIKEFNDC